MANEKNLKITKEIFKGDGGKEKQIANDVTTSLQIQLDVLMSVLTTEQKQAFNEKIADWKEFITNTRQTALEYYTLKQHCINKKTIFEEVEKLRNVE